MSCSIAPVVEIFPYICSEDAFNIQPTHYDEMVGVDLWYLDHINDSKLMYLSELIKQAEWAFNIKRVKAPNIIECPWSEATFRWDKHRETTKTGWRFIGNLFEDTIEVAAKYLLESYKQLPYCLSCEDAIYTKICVEGEAQCRIRQQYVWSAAIYGADYTNFVNILQEHGFVVQINIQKSRNQVRGADNCLFYPEVSILTVVLIDGGEKLQANS